ncbi:MAG: archaeosortase A [Methanogenium sp.]|nr:archaeosortase A [Methanogenium sp.]
MEVYLVLISSIMFIAFLIPSSKRKYFAIMGWFAIVASILIDLPIYFSENNFIYPIMGLLGIPFLAITISELLKENKLVIQLSRVAAIAFLIYFPFAYMEPLGNWLISVVYDQMLVIFSVIGFQFTQVDWNMVMHDSFRVEIILACTGIQSIAIMLAVAWAVPTTTRQKILSFLLIVPVIYVLNIFRNIFVVIAYTEQWFPYLPEIASNGETGYESYFWAHNVLCELGALVALILIAYLLFLLIPQLGEFADGILRLYLEKIREGGDKGKKFFAGQKD